MRIWEWDLHWDTNVNLRAPVELRDNRDRSIHQFDALAHTDKTEPSPFTGSFDGKANASICDCELNFAWGSPALHLKTRSPAMLRSVMSGLLQDPE
jgi:hypothetical protein